MRHIFQSQPSGRLPKPAHWSRALLANLPLSKFSPTAIPSKLRGACLIPALFAVGLAGSATRLVAQTTIFSENLGVPINTNGFAIATYATGTAPATFQNVATLTYGTGEQAAAADIRKTSASNNSGSSGEGNVFFSSSSTAGDRGFSIESINASAFNTLQLSYGYRKNSGSAFAGLSVDYWNGAAWVTVANTSNDLFNELPTATSGWYPAKTLSLPAGAQIAGLKLRFVKSGTIELRIDDIKLTGTPAGGDVTAPLISTYSPVNGAMEISIFPSIVASFDEAVQAGTGAIELKKTSDNSTVPSTFSVGGSSLSIFPDSALELGTDYNIRIAPGAIKDLANNNFLGITNATTWAFKTDNTGPVAVTYTPANGVTGIAPPTTLTLKFNENIQLPLFSGTASIFVKNSGGTPVATFDSYVFETGLLASGTDLTISLPPGTIDYGASYYVEIEAGAVENESELPFAGFSGNMTWAFSTVNVPSLTTGPGYTQNFSTFTSAGPFPVEGATLLPLGWSISGDDLSYDGDWGSGFSGGFRGNANVFGFQHTSGTGLLLQTLTLRNSSGAPITDLTVSYDGRVERAIETRIPIYTVTVDGVAVSDLTYSTSSADNSPRSKSLAGLNIPDGATFQIQWASDRGLSAGSSRQIGISNVAVSIGSTTFAPTVTNTVPIGSVSSSGATLEAAIVSDGGSAITERGFVYSITATNSSPTIGGSGVSQVVDALVGTDPFSTVVSGLSQVTEYTMSAYAINGVGTSYGAPKTFTTQATPPSFTGSYFEPFDAYDGTNPAGWSAISSLGAQSYASAWGTGTSAGFTGGESNPGVLGYQHTGGTGTLTTTLKFLNGTGGTLTQLYVSYLGQASRTDQGRSPVFVVSINGVEIPALAYSTLGNVDLTVATTVTGLSIAPGALFTLSWVSDRGAGAGSSKQIGLGEVRVGISAPAGYDDWKTANVGGQSPSEDFDLDGIPNGAEYFMGTAGDAFTVNPGIDSFGVVTWPRDLSATISSFKVETSPDLVTWTDASISYPANLSITGSNVAFTMPTGPTKVFVRLNVTP